MNTLHIHMSNVIYNIVLCFPITYGIKHVTQVTPPLTPIDEAYGQCPSCQLF